MADSKEINDYSSELLPLQNAIEKIDDKDKKTIAEAKITKLKSEIAIGKTRASAIEEINKLKAEYISASKEEKNLSPNIKILKDKIEKYSNEPLAPLSLSNILKELPKDDVIGRAYIVQYVIGKIRKDGYEINLNKKGVILSTDNNNIKKNGVALEETFNNHIESEALNKKDLEQAMIISSGSLTEFSQTYGDNIPENVDNEDYIKYLYKKHSLSSDISVEGIKNCNTLSANEKSLLISYSCGGISSSNINPTIKNYNEMKEQAKVVFDSDTFKTFDKMLSGDKTPKNAKDLADKVAKDPSVLSGKPMTAIAAGLAVIFGLGYKKGSGFDLWTGLKRGFMGIFALLIGGGVAKEWGMDPKKLLKEGMDLMKEGSEKAKDAVKGDAEKAKDAAKGEGEENEPSKGLTKGQEKASQKVTGDNNFVNALNNKADENAKSNNTEIKKKTGKIEDYLNFINSTLKDKKLEELIFTGQLDNSIFSDSSLFDFKGIAVPLNLERSYLKRVLRLYITGKYKLVGAKDNKVLGQVEKEEFEAKYPKETNKNKTLLEFLEEINK